MSRLRISNHIKNHWAVLSVLLLIASSALMGFSWYHHQFCMHELRVERFAAQSESNRIEWKSAAQLNWSDFEAEPLKYYPNIAAVTTSLIQYRYMCTGENLRFSCKAIFLKDESWVRDDSKTRNYLQHEQGHFNITEVFSRKLQAAIDLRSYACEDEAVLEADIEKVLEKWRDLETRYDKSTKYSLDEKMQKQWVKYIKELLASPPG